MKNKSNEKTNENWKKVTGIGMKMKKVDFKKITILFYYTCYYFIQTRHFFIYIIYI